MACAKQLHENSTKSILNEIKIKLNEIEFNFNNPENYIYEECAKIIDQIQLEKEKQIVNVKLSNEIDINTEDDQLSGKILQKVQKISNYCDSLIDEVECFKKESLAKLKAHAEKDLNEWNTFIRKSKERIDEYDIYFSDKSNGLKIPPSMTILHKKLLDKEKNLPIFIFSNNLIFLKQALTQQVDQLNCYITYRKLLNFKELKCYDLSISAVNLTYGNINEKTSFLCDVFTDGKFLIGFFDTQKIISEILIFDTSKNEITKSLKLENMKIMDFKIAEIAILLSGQKVSDNNEANLFCNRIAVVTDFNLDVLKKSTTHYHTCIIISHSKPYFILEYCYESQFLTAFDSTLSEVKKIQFQSVDITNPFYIDHQDTISQFEFMPCNYVYKCFRKNKVTILDLDGFIVNEIKCNEFLEFRVSSRNYIIVPTYIFTDTLQNIIRINMYDLSGMLRNELSLLVISKFKFGLFNVFIDQNSNIYIYNYNLLKLFLIQN